MSKLEKLAEIREKCTLSHKQEALTTLRSKVKALNEQRHRNALRCLQVVGKYEKLLGIRIKDTVFKYWEKVRREGSAAPTTLSANMSASEIGDTSAHGVSLTQSCSVSSIHNGSSFLDESSITSALYMRAKAVYKLRKLFNKRRLKPAFDAFLIKTYHLHYRHQLFNLEALRLLAIHRILSRTVRRLNERVFAAFVGNSYHRSVQQRTLHKIASRRGLREMSFGLKQWQQYTEKSLKHELRKDKTFITQLADHVKDTSFLQQIMT